MREENAVWVRIDAEDKILRYIIEKGSIAIDGISLTVAETGPGYFKVSIIPHTGEETTLLRPASGRYRQSGKRRRRKVCGASAEFQRRKRRGIRTKGKSRRNRFKPALRERILIAQRRHIPRVCRRRFLSLCFVDLTDGDCREIISNKKVFRSAGTADNGFLEENMRQEDRKCLNSIR